MANLREKGAHRTDIQKEKPGKNQGEIKKNQGKLGKLGKTKQEKQGKQRRQTREHTKETRKS